MTHQTAHSIRNLLGIMRTAWAATIMAGCFAAPSASAADLVTVKLTDGRTLAARLDGRTNNHRLWLRFEGESTSLLRPIAWNQVALAKFESKEINAAQFQDAAISYLRQPNRADNGRIDEYAGADRIDLGGRTYAEVAAEAIADAE